MRRVVHIKIASLGISAFKNIQRDCALYGLLAEIGLFRRSRFIKQILLVCLASFFLHFFVEMSFRGDVQ